MMITKKTPSDAETQALSRPWFYRVELPCGEVTESNADAEVQAIHDNRLQMGRDAWRRHFGNKAIASAIDIACHQGFFAVQMADEMARVTAVDMRQRHLDDTNLLAAACEKDNIATVLSDVHDLTAAEHGQHDVVLMLGLLYHLENPVGAMRVARALTRSGGLALFETQVVPNMSGHVDWGHPDYVRPLQGVFGLIDEYEETHGGETSTTGICLAPSIEGLLWCLHRVGFDRVERLLPPPDGYQQLVTHRRVMVAAYVDS